MALGSVANILLEVTGNSSEARKELAEVARDLALFSREEAEAAAYVDGSEAQRELDELRVALQAIDAKKVSAEVNVQIAKALGDIAVLERELKAIHDEEVEVDVDVRRGVAERLGALSGLIGQIGAQTEEVSGGGLRQFAAGVLDADIGVGRWSTSLANILKFGPAVLAVIFALAGQLIAVAASAINAAGGIGALGVAFGAALVPGILLAIGAVARFKEQSEIAGTAAHALKEAFGDFGSAFKNATAGGADALFRGLGDALRTMQPVVEALGPAFTQLGQAGAEALRGLADHFASPVWRGFFEFATDSLTRLTPLFARSFGAMADILRNIATAAMPYLIDGFRSLAEFLEGLADDTSNIDALRGSIGGMVTSLGQWIDFMGGAIDLSAALVAALAPIGDEIVGALGEGARNLAEWIRSSEGAEKLKQFFEDTGPLAAEVAKLILNIGLALIQIGQFVAPALTPIVKGFNEFLGVLNRVFSWLNDNVSAGFRAALGSIVALVTGFGRLGKAGELLSGLLRLLVGAAGAVGGALGDVGSAAARGFSAAVEWARNAVDTIANVVGKPIRFVLQFADNIAERANSIWGHVQNAITKAIQFVINFAGNIAERAGNIWDNVRSAIRKSIDFVIGFADNIANRAGAIWDNVRSAIKKAIDFALGFPEDIAARANNVFENVKRALTKGIDIAVGFADDIVDKAKALWNEISNALPDITINIDIPKPNLPDIPGMATGVRNLASGGLYEVGEIGPELMYVPTGADVFTADETRSILRALAAGVTRPAAATSTPIMAGGRSQHIEQNNDIKIISPGTGSPDPDIALAKLDAALRGRAVLGA